MFDIEFARRSFWPLLRAAPVTIYISVLSILIGMAVGLVFCIIRVKKIPVLNTVVSLLDSLIRSTPILIQLYVVCYGIPRINAFVHGNPMLVSGVKTSPMTMAVITFTVYAACYMSDIYISAYHGISDGQIEAAQSFNIPAYRYIFRIIMPQGIPMALPNMSNMAVDLIKNTSLVYIISVMDIMAKGYILAAE